MLSFIGFIAIFVGAVNVLLYAPIPLRSEDALQPGRGTGIWTMLMGLAYLFGGILAPVAGIPATVYGLLRLARAGHYGMAARSRESHAMAAAWIAGGLAGVLHLPFGGAASNPLAAVWALLTLLWLGLYAARLYNRGMSAMTAYEPLFEPGKRADFLRDVTPEQSQHFTTAFSLRADQARAVLRDDPAVELTGWQRTSSGELTCQLDTGGRALRFVQPSGRQRDRDAYWEWLERGKRYSGGLAEAVSDHPDDRAGLEAEVLRVLGTPVLLKPVSVSTPGSDQTSVGDSAP